MELSTGELMAAIAARIDANKDSIGLQGVSYPPLNFVRSSPWLMIRQSITGMTQVTKERAGQQVVRPSIDLVALVVADPNKPNEASRLDSLQHPLLDLFDANAAGGNVNYAFSGLLTKSVDRVWNEALVRRGTIPWGESGDCHALIITLDSEFKRKAILP